MCRGSDDTMLYVDFCKIVLTPPEFEQVHATAVLGADWKSGGGRFAALMEEFQVRGVSVDAFVHEFKHQFQPRFQRACMTYCS